MSWYFKRRLCEWTFYFFQNRIYVCIIQVVQHVFGVCSPEVEFIFMKSHKSFLI